MPSPWTAQALDALTTAINNDWDGACEKAVDILAEHGGDTIAALMLCWIDATLHTTGVGVCREDRIMAPLFLDPVTGQPGDVDAAPPGVRFAGRLMAARATGDRQAAFALVSALKTSEELADSMFAVLNVCSATLRWAAGLPVA